MNRLDTAALPLSGMQLIEASAGTGKTHAITTLYLRLLLETDHTVRDILVVTFTVAATQELRARIRNRLLDAQRLLAAPETIAAETDPALRAVLQRQVDEQRVPFALRKLALTLAAIDEAAIFTIHSFCQRALRDHAFESGETFTAELADNPGDIVATAVADWWRQRFYRDPVLAGFAAGRSALCTPTTTLAWMNDLLSRDPELRLPVCDVTATLSLAAELRARWPGERAGFVAALAANPHLSRRRDKSMHADFVAGLAALDVWAAADSLAPAADAAHLGQQGLDAHVTPARRDKGGAAPQLPFAAGLDRLLAALDALELHLLAEARAETLRRSDERKRHADVLGFDDLVARLRAALSGPGGERLANRLATQYPAAMIDEFQDTDPAQYDIFERLYRGRDAGCLLMIGDPKQAIYSFRGADIYAYVRARRATPAAQRHTMTHNWRSTRALVEGVDALFARLPEPFLMGSDVGWTPVAASGRADARPLRIDGVLPVPLQFFVPDDGATASKDAFRADAAAAVATQCVRLLSAAAAGRATIGDVALAPRDIAILVRTHDQATRMQEALRARGIASALSSRHSVLDSPEAADLAHVLDALRDPADERALKRALLAPAWGWPADRLAATLADEGAWERLLDDVAEWHRLWLARGFMPMFRHWLHRAGIPARLLARPRGERALTNLLHLAELLQDAAREHGSPDELCRWLARARNEPGTDGEERQLRLDSDEDLVQVVTQHKSKGLEYPVVFLPFVGVAPERGKANGKPLYHDANAQDRLVLDYRDPAAAFAGADREALAEDMRLLYVALTRAQYLCSVHWGAINSGFPALALLLHGVPGDTPEQARARCAALAKAGQRAVADDLRPLIARHPASLCLREPEIDGTVLSVAPEDRSHWQVRAPRRSVDHDWRVTSFSALASQQPAQAPEAAAATGSAREDADVDATTDAADAIGNFPRGTRAGHFFHELLENLDFPAARGTELAREIGRQCMRHGMPARWQDTVATCIADVLDTPLADGLTLRALTKAQRRNECEFYYPLEKLDAAALERVVPGLAGLDARTPRFTFAPVSGLMHGFIDLVFEHGGRWFVADWKTNWLGPNAAHYGRAALQDAMRHHAYDLQYWIYSVALHRHLQQKLGAAYDYDRHVGGVYYFFLRGMRPARGMDTGVVFERPPRAQLEALDALLRGHSAGQRR